eukprot:6196251-Pleurochrysis_carterae.AAC.7
MLVYGVAAQVLAALGIQELMPMAAKAVKPKPTPAAQAKQRRGKLGPMDLWLAKAAKTSRPAPVAHRPTEQDTPCETCGGRDDEEGNDILLCDGDGCQRG